AANRPPEPARRYCKKSAFPAPRTKGHSKTKAFRKGRQCPKPPARLLSAAPDCNTGAKEKALFERLRNPSRPFPIFRFSLRRQFRQNRSETDCAQSVRACSAVPKGAANRKKCFVFCLS